MIITEFESFNEGFNIDIKKIKEEAKKFSQSKECRSILSNIDMSLLDSSIKELKKLREKWGSIDNLSNRIFSKANTQNEGISSVIILSMFGIHAFIKLLTALKNDMSFLQYLGRLFHSGYEDLKSVRDVLIMVTFIIYSIVYIIGNNTYIEDSYRGDNNTASTIHYQWDGIHNYKIVDNYDKIYQAIRSDNGYDILYKGKKIGTTDGINIFRLSGDKILGGINSEDIVSANSIIKIDLERKLSSKIDPKKQADVSKKISDREKDIKRLEREIDSISGISIYENLDIAKRILRGAGRNYDLIIGNTEGRMDIRDSKFLNIKNELTRKNNIGYLGLFTNIIYNDPKGNSIQIEDIMHLYRMILESNDIISNLRDNNGELTTLDKLKTYEKIQDSLTRLEDWRIVNKFIREIPSSQKNLIWSSGYFINDLKNSSEFLTKSLIKISKSPELSQTFLSKISAAKTKEAIISSITKLVNEEPWEFDYCLNKLNNLRGVYVTWSSKEEKQIIFLVSSYNVMKKVAYMTNWCIASDSYYFKRYSNKGFQFVLYDFNYPSTSNISVIGFSLNDPNHKNKITDCHRKNDSSHMIPDKFLLDKSYRYNHFIKNEYIIIDPIKAAMKFDRTFYKLVKNKFTKFLHSPIISNFIDYYDDGD